MKRMFLLMAASAMTAPALAAAMPDSLDAGAGKNGEVCRAERVWHDAASRDLFDQVYNVRCLGWTETETVGTVRLLMPRRDRESALKTALGEQLTCGTTPRSNGVEGIGPVSFNACVNRSSGFPEFHATASAGNVLLSMQGLQVFSANVLAVSRALLAARPELAKIKAEPLNFERLDMGSKAAAGNDAVAQRTADDTIGRQIREYSIRAQFGIAREVAVSNLTGLPADITAVTRLDLTLESALAASNLGFASAAAADFASADALLTMVNAEAPSPQARKLALYKGLDALNRHDYAAAAAFARKAIVAGGPAGSSARPTVAAPRKAAGNLILGDSSADASANLLNMQGSFVLAAAARNQNDLKAAATALAAADQSYQQMVAANQDVSNLAWLRSQLAAEHGRLLRLECDRSNQCDGSAALAAAQQALAELAGASGFAQSPLIAQRHIEVGNAALRAGNEALAREQFQQGVDLLGTLGSGTAETIGGLDPWVALLARDAAAGGDKAAAAKTQLFATIQLLNPPAVASQIAALEQAFQSGNSEAAVKQRALAQLDQEIRGKQSQLAQQDVSQETIGGVNRANELRLEVTELEAKRTAIRAELGTNQQYNLSRDLPVKLKDFQDILKDNEAYLRLVTVQDDVFMMVIRKTDMAVAKLPTKLAELTKNIDQVQKTVRPLAGEPQPFNVKAAYRLKDSLFSGVGTILTGVGTLITDSNGPMANLPFGLLVQDKESLTAYDSSDYSRVRFLIDDYRVITSVSPGSFVTLRNLPHVAKAAYPYLGLGAHRQPADATQYENLLAKRGFFRDQCVRDKQKALGIMAGLVPVGGQELRDVAKIMQVGAGDVIEQDQFFDNDLTNAAAGPVGSRLGKYAVLHFATHGLMENELGCDNPPALVTSTAPEGDSDGLLTFEDVARLTLNADLVLLTACNSSAAASSGQSGAAGFRSDVGKASTLSGLVRSFFVAGTRSVIASYWPVVDYVWEARVSPDPRVSLSDQKVTVPLVPALFTYGIGGRLDEALRQAQRDVKRRPSMSHPYVWANLFMVGDGSQTLIPKPQAAASGAAGAAAQGGGSR